MAQTRILHLSQEESQALIDFFKTMGSVPTVPKRFGLREIDPQALDTERGNASTEDSGHHRQMAIGSVPHPNPEVNSPDAAVRYSGIMYDHLVDAGITKEEIENTQIVLLELMQLCPNISGYFAAWLGPIIEWIRRNHGWDVYGHPSDREPPEIQDVSLPDDELS